MNSRRLVVSVALGAMVFAVVSAASAQCFRHEECPADQLCLEQTCSDPDEPLDTCGTADDCTGGLHLLCDDGYCKTDGVYCQNPAGHCNFDNGWFTCGCEDGMGYDGGGPEEDPPPTDEDLYAECVDILVMMCGEEAPDINDECTPEQLETCEEYFDWINQLLVACEWETDEVGYAQLASCCHDLEDGDEWFQDQIDCVMALTLEECADLADCYEDGEDGGSSDTDVDSDSDTDSDSDADGEPDPGKKDTGGCGIAPRAEGFSLLLGMLLLALLGY
jgi:hypothetical protein